jgi:hypothetical protein
MENHTHTYSSKHEAISSPSRLFGLWKQVVLAIDNGHDEMGRKTLMLV